MKKSILAGAFAFFVCVLLFQNCRQGFDPQTLESLEERSESPIGGTPPNGNDDGNDNNNPDDNNSDDNNNNEPDPFNPSLYADIDTVADLQAGDPELLADNTEFSEGPFWHTSNRVFFSALRSEEGQFTEYTAGGLIKPNFNGQLISSNGMRETADGEIIVCGNEDNVMYAISADLSELRVLASADTNGNLQRPNDITIDSQGRIWFTSPSAGTIHRINADNTIERLFLGSERGEQLTRPNGIELSPNEQTLYIAQPSIGIFRLPILADGQLGPSTLFAELFRTDGIKVDIVGNLYSSGEDGIRVYRADGTEFEGSPIDVGGRVVNLHFGEEDWQTLFFTTTNSLGRVRVNIPGLPHALK